VEVLAEVVVVMPLGQQTKALLAVVEQALQNTAEAEVEALALLV
jgi:hypothetical protein